MFSRISALITVAIAAAACARMERHVRRANTTTSPGTCNTDGLSCCGSTTQASNLANIFDLLGYVYDPADSVGIDCTPLNLVGAGEGAACQQMPVCCTNVTESGWVNFGCSPVDLN